MKIQFAFSFPVACLTTCGLYSHGVLMKTLWMDRQTDPGTIYREQVDAVNSLGHPLPTDSLKVRILAAGNNDDHITLDCCMICDYLVPSRLGEEPDKRYLFSEDGKHLYTISAAGNSRIWFFEYDVLVV